MFYRNYCLHCLLVYKSLIFNELCVNNHCLLLFIDCLFSFYSFLFAPFCLKALPQGLNRYVIGLKAEKLCKKIFLEKNETTWAFK